MASAQTESSTRRGGRRETLTLDLAKKIAEMIRRFPDKEIPVTWQSIEIQVEKRFKLPLKRNVLSTKEWNGCKLIWEAYDEAGKVQSRLRRQAKPKYATSSRASLRALIADLEAKVERLQAELDAVRERQYDELCVLWTRNTSLPKLLDDASSTP